MGNQESLTKNVPTFQEDEWEFIETNSEHPEYGWYRALKNSVTGQLVDQYELTFLDEQDYRYYLDSFIWRMKEP